MTPAVYNTDAYRSSTDPITITVVGAATNMPEEAHNVSPRDATKLADEQLLASLGYKQEFKREFSPLEVNLYQKTFQ